jgi:hypothetical protein
VPRSSGQIIARQPGVIGLVRRRGIRLAGLIASAPVPDTSPKAISAQLAARQESARSLESRIREQDAST